MQPHAERLGDGGPVVFEIGARDRAADPVEIGGDLAADIAAIEVVETGIGELIEGGGEVQAWRSIAPASGALPSAERSRRSRARPSAPTASPP